MLEIKFDLTDFESVELINLADIHIGHPLCQEHIFKEIVDYINEEPDDPKMARICLLNGDLTESATKTNRNGNVFEQTMTPAVQVATIVKYLQPLAETRKKYPQGKILSYCAGNHDGDRYKETGISASETIAVQLGLQERYSTDGCYSFISLGRKGRGKKEIITTTVYNTHGTGGGSTIGGKANRIARIGQGIVANVICMSHVHQPMTFKEDIFIPTNQNSLSQRTITYVINGAFLNYGDYAQRNGYKPSTIAIPKIYIKQGRDYTNYSDVKYTYTEVLL